MADIISRLFQLTAKSSNLVLVGCSKASQQQQLQNEFLSLQAENVEVSFFAAEQHTSTTELRKTVFQQFTQKNASDYRLEVKDLFKRQLPNNSPNVLCITQADNLPDQFVAELFRWITAIQTGLAKDNINILLFASQAWGEVKHQWLDKQSSSSPVFISATSTDAVGFDVNELEQLMDERRAFFAKDGVFGTNQAASKLMRNTWFKSGIACVFLLFFTGILAAQYTNQLKALLNDIEPQQYLAAQASENMPVDEAVNNEQAKDPLTEESDIVDELDAANVASAIKETPTIALESVNNADQQNTSGENEKYRSVTSEILAGSWQGDTAVNDNTIDLADAAEKPMDYQVPDITSVSQLDEKLSSLRAQSNEDTTKPQPGTSSELTTISTSLVKTSAPGAVRTKKFGVYNFDEELLLQLPNNQVVLQLSGMRDISILNTFLEKNALNSDIWIYQTELNGKDWFVVLHGDTFDDNYTARQGTPQLPNGLFSSRPFTKTIAQIRYEITGLY
ncbi:MAG: hypothetical protein AAGJ37_03880 [Pseudomonadota bacterium]